MVLVGIAGAAHDGSLFGDFRAFYCAGSVVLHGGDPYLAAPMLACESPVQPFSLYHAQYGIVLPAPLPGYALLPFVALALVPFPLAALIWIGVLLGACALAWRSLAFLVDDEFEAIVLAAALPLGAVAIPFGELVPIAVAAFCACGVALKRNKPWSAVAWASVAMLQPHVGLPVLAALVGWERTRWRAALAIVALAVAHALVLGPQAVEYFTHVLPQHALAELPRSSQFSFAWIAQALGVPAQAALLTGSFVTALALGGGISVAAFLMLRTARVELLALVPPAFALIGGTFIHIAQMLIALPAVLAMLPLARGRNRALLAASLVLLAIPWNVASHSVWMMPVVGLVAGGITLVSLAQPPIVALRVAFGCVLYFGVVACARAFVPPSPALPAPSFDPLLASASWGTWIHLHDSDASVAVWLAKLPTWIGLALFAGASISVVRERPATVAAADDSAPIAS